MYKSLRKTSINTYIGNQINIQDPEELKISLWVRAGFLNLSTWEKGNEDFSQLYRNTVNLEENKCL